VLYLKSQSEKEAKKFMYKIKLTDFEGPLDLLLFFIKRDELDVYDIPISKITRDFLDSIAETQSLDLEVASEFIYFASVLISIKAKMLLPRPETAAEDDGDFDPRTELVQRLLEYRRFKEMSEVLQSLEDDRRKAYAKGIMESFEVANPDNLIKPTLFDLMAAYRTALEKIPVKKYHEIVRLNVTVDEQIDFLLRKLDEKMQVSFFEVTHEFTDRIYLVVTFLSILEMTKNRLITIIQKENYNDFWISKI
jgi:segregation and condensation protein A